jgi:hypothetical protein
VPTLPIEPQHGRVPKKGPQRRGQLGNGTASTAYRSVEAPASKIHDPNTTPSARSVETTALMGVDVCV